MGAAEVGALDSVHIDRAAIALRLALSAHAKAEPDPKACGEAVQRLAHLVDEAARSHGVTHAEAMRSAATATFAHRRAMVPDTPYAQKVREVGDAFDALRTWPDYPALVVAARAPRTSERSARLLDLMERMVVRTGVPAEVLGQFVQWVHERPRPG